MKEKREFLVLTERREKHANTWLAALLKSVSAMAVTVAAAGMFFMLGKAPVLSVSVFVAFFSVVGITAVNSLRKGRYYGTFLCLMIAAVIFFSSVPGVVREIRAWSNDFRDIWNQVFGTFYEGAVVSHRETDLKRTEIIIVLLTAAAIIELIQRRNFALLTMIAFGPLCLGLTLSLKFPSWLLALLLTGWIGAWRAMSGPEGIRWETVILIVGVGAVLCFLPLVFPGILWQQSAVKFQVRVKQGMEKFRFGEDTLPQGNLMKADRMLSGTESRLELEMEKPTSVYLRGYVGAKYEENQWKPFSAKVYGGDFSGMISWFSGQDFHPGMQYADYKSVSGEDSDPELSVSVKNVGASRRYLYLPATASAYTGNKGKWRQDWFLEALGWFGQKEYGFTYYDAQRNAEVQSPGSWIYQEGGDEYFRQAERVYRSFVYAHYLEISEEQKALIDDIFFRGDRQEETEGVYSITSRIRTVLRIIADYQEIPLPVPANQDFFPWFFQEGKEGNSAYYATAAVMAYRAAGIPARYVEGYVLTKTQAEQAEGNTMTLTSQNAHAWVEVYVDGTGWRTMEVTPGFYEEVYQADIIVAVPNESFEGANGDAAGFLPSEEYEFPEEEQDVPLLPQKDEVIFHLFFLVPLILALLAEILAIIQALCLERRYRRMTGKAKMYFLYALIMDMVGKLYKNFNPAYPLELPEREDLSFDIGLYRRTVERMEKVIYGQEEPAPREISSTEALTAEVRDVLYKKLGWRRWIFRNTLALRHWLGNKESMS